MYCRPKAAISTLVGTMALNHAHVWKLHVMATTIFAMPSDSELDDRGLDHHKAVVVREERSRAENDDEAHACPLHGGDRAAAKFLDNDLQNAERDRDADGERSVARRRKNDDEHDRRQQIGNESFECGDHDDTPFLSEGTRDSRCAT